MMTLKGITDMQQKVKKVVSYLNKELVLFIIGGLIYVTIEILGRGFSHFSMFICGGLCFVIIGLINEWFSYEMLFQHQMILGAFTITCLEFIFGYIVNIRMGLNVWDYSDMKFNLYGQICLHHSICYWIPLAGVAIVLDDLIRWKLFKEQKPKYVFIKNKLIK